MFKFCILLILFLIAQSKAISAQQYSITEIPTFGGEWSSAIALSDAGHVVGTSETGVSYHSISAFLFYHDEMQELPNLGNPRGNQANDVNSRGQIVGSSNPHAFLYSKGVLTDLGTLGGSSSSANGINASSTIVGQAANANGITRAFIYKQGNMVDLGTPGSLPSSAHDINSAGVVVGIFYLDATGNFVHAFRYDHGTVQDLGTLGGRTSWGLGINNRGDIVGASEATSGAWHAILIRDGEMIDVGSYMGANTVSTARAINDAAQIVGEYTSQINAATRPFLLQDEEWIDLNELLPANSGWILKGANDINNAGEIVGTGSLNGMDRGFILRPAYNGD